MAVALAGPATRSPAVPGRSLRGGHRSAPPPALAGF